MRRGIRESAGFTLIELLVVIAVIAILAAILLSVLAQAQKRAQAVFQVPVFQSVLGRQITDGAVKPDGIVMVDKFAGDLFGLLQIKWGLLTDTITLESAVPAFNFAVALRVMRRGPHMRQLSQPDKFLEVFGDKLGSVVADDSRTRDGELFQGGLENDFDLCFGHGSADFPVDDVATGAINDAAQVVERPSDVQIADVHMPMLMRLQWLHEAGAFARGLEPFDHEAGLA